MEKRSRETNGKPDYYFITLILNVEYSPACHNPALQTRLCRNLSHSCCCLKLRQTFPVKFYWSVIERFACFLLDIASILVVKANRILFS